MKARSSRHLQIDVAIADDDPLRMIGFRALLEQEHADLDVAPIRLMEMKASLHASVVLLRDRAGHNLADEIDKLKAALPGTRILVTGPSPDENAILESLSLGARGYLSETASSADFVKAIRIVHQGLIWAPATCACDFYWPGCWFPSRCSVQACNSHRPAKGSLADVSSGTVKQRDCCSARNRGAYR